MVPEVIDWARLGRMDWVGALLVSLAIFALFYLLRWGLRKEKE